MMSRDISDRQKIESGETKRLIDANRLEFYGKYYNKSQMKAILDFIDMQPTVYDIEKVVEKMQEASKIYCTEYHQREGNLNIVDAVEIVKTGGMKCE